MTTHTPRSLKTPLTRETGGRSWAYAAMLTGGTISVWANIEHARILGDAHRAGASAQALSIVFAVFWPLCTLMALEIITRAVVLRGYRHIPLRYGALLPIGLVAGTVSYLDISALLRHYGAQPVVSTIGPLAIDGLMLLGAAVVYLTGQAAQATLGYPVPVEGEPESEEVSQDDPDMVSQVSPRPVVSLGDRPNLTEARLQMIKEAEPAWREIGGAVTKRRIGEIIGLPNASRTQQELRNLLVEQAS